jgi:methionyl aminopeptidase
MNKNIENINIKDLLNIEAKLEEINKTDKELFHLIEGIEDWLLAGKVTAFLLDYGKTLIKNNKKLRDIANKIEEKITELNKESSLSIKLAFPVNISLDNCAAHYSPGINDETIFQNNIVKLDIGININGAIGDAAITIDLTNNNEALAKCVEIARDKAIELVRPGIKVTELGKIIEKTIKLHGLKPIKNLGGHQIERYNLHAGIFIPNYNSGDKNKLKKGDILAIEPFASTGKGYVENTGIPEIFLVIQGNTIKNRNTKKILNAIDYFDSLPFSKLNLNNISSKNSLEKINQALTEINELNRLHSFHPLSDQKNTLTSQSEHTVIVGNKAIITTVY